MAGPETPLFAEMWARERQTVADQVAAGIASHADGEDHRRPRGLDVLGCTIGSPAAGGGGDWTHIATVTVGVSSVPSIDFAGIPGTYRHLKLLGQVKCDYGGGATAALELQINGDTTAANYLYYTTAGDNGNHFYDWQSSTDGGIYLAECPGPGNGAYGTAAFEATLFNYAGATFNQPVHSQALSRITADPELKTVSGWWDQLAAVTDLSLFIGAAGPPNFVTGSTVSLYGIG